MKSFRAPLLFKVFLVVALLFALARIAHAGEPGDLRKAFEDMRAGDYASALPTAGPEGSIARDVIEWHRLRAGKGAFPDYIAFMSRRGDWPGLPLLMREGEATIDETATPQQVAGYFDIEAPQTADGLVAAVKAYRVLGREGDAEALTVLGWRSMSLGSDDQAALRAMYPELLKPHDIARMDMLLWRGLKSEALRMKPLVPTAWRLLADARIGLRDMAGDVDTLISLVPEALQDDPGLAYERYLWRKRKGRDADALEMLLERSGSAARLGDPSRWSGDRRDIARALMRDGQPKIAYKVASEHFLLPGADDYPDLEWLSGYIALRFLDDPETALEHFTRFQNAVDTPISLGRAGYWVGRALEAAGRDVDAQAAYEFGAEFQTSFYGLLAAERAGLPLDPALIGTETNPDWHGAAFLQSSVMKAALMLHKAGERDLSERFMRHLCESLDGTAMAQMADMALDMGDAHIALRIAKYAAGQGITLNRPYYPVPEMAKAKLPVPMELALSIARRESEFDPVVVSHAGARGLMQLMPGTARDMAREVGVDYSTSRLTSDPAYNATLGSAYLAHLIERFGHNWMMVAAGYNAGPGRPLRWMQDYGDPRDKSGPDPVDWIEMIPFDETRNYVMRVTESIPVYRARLSGKTGPITLIEDLTAR